MSHVSIYVDGMNISTANVSVRKGDVIREIAALEAYIGTTKSEQLQRIAGERIKELIKELINPPHNSLIEKKMTLPHDYSRCATEGCDKEEQCARKEIPDRHYSVAEFDKDDCENFIDKEVKP